MDNEGLRRPGGWCTAAAHQPRRFWPLGISGGDMGCTPTRPTAPLWRHQCGAGGPESLCPSPAPPPLPAPVPGPAMAADTWWPYPGPPRPHFRPGRRWREQQQRQGSDSFVRSACQPRALPRLGVVSHVRIRARLWVVERPPFHKLRTEDETLSIPFGLVRRPVGHGLDNTFA